MRHLIAFSCLLSIALASSIEWTGSNTGKDVLVSWTSDSNTITFTVTANTTGWIGIGFSPTGSMAGADIIIGWVDDSGVGNVKDCFANANGAPYIDENQDITLLGSSEVDSITTLTFQRPLDTGDTDSDRVITADTTRLLLALGESDPTSSLSFQNGDVHTDRGVIPVYLLDPAEEPIILPDDIQSFEMRSSNKTIPHDVDTLYWCTYHKLPTLQRKHHVVQIKPLIEHLDHVHHILGYGCHGLTETEIAEAGLTDPHQCKTANMPEFSAKCVELTFGWAVGGSIMNYPAEAGFPIGPESGEPDYIMLELHYDNPNLLQGRVDNSGLELIYTPTLRTYDAGLLMVGTVTGIVIPPGNENFVVSGYCSGNCTHDFIRTTEGVNVINYALHTHLLGSAIRVNQYRNGRFLRVIAYDDYYDFNYQAIRSVREPVDILPGDSLETRCTMKSSDRTGITYGGLSTRDEMCLGFLFYYPKQSAGPCISMPEFLVNPISQLYSNLGVIPSVHLQSGMVDLNSTLTGVAWEDVSYKTLEDAYEYQPFYQLCSNEGGDPYSSNFVEMSPPERVNDGMSTPSEATVLLQSSLFTISFLLFLI